MKVLNLMFFVKELITCVGQKYPEGVIPLCGRFRFPVAPEIIEDIVNYSQVDIFLILLNSVFLSLKKLYI